jgi:pimeloyl-ACP methyl ester carboxylesterase
VPHLGRGDRPAIEAFRFLYQGKFFYQLYFQQPGVAEAELEADSERTIRLLYFAASGDATGDQRGFMQNKRPDANLLDGLAEPDPLPAWMSREDIAYVASQFQAGGFRGPLNRYRNFERDWERLPELGATKVPQPALFIAGDRDPVLDLVPGMKLTDAMDPWYADLRGKVLIEGAGHWVQQERPAEVNRAILAFLNSL